MFDAMLSIPQPVTDKNHDVPVIPVTEDSVTLRGILELCYPMAPSIVREKNLDVVLHIIDAAMKYSMDWPVELVAQSLKDLAIDQPLRVYAIAQRHRMPELAEYAAQETLRYPFPGEYCPELEDISGGAYFRLVKYHENCSKALVSIPLELAWLGRRSQYVWYTCQNVKCSQTMGKYTYEGFAPKVWWANWLDGAVAEIRRRPCKDAALRVDIESASLKESCSSCKARAHIDLSKCRALLADEVKKRLTAVSPQWHGSRTFCSLTPSG